MLRKKLQKAVELRYRHRLCLQYLSYLSELGMLEYMMYVQALGILVQV